MKDGERSRAKSARSASRLNSSSSPSRAEIHPNRNLNLNLTLPLPLRSSSNMVGDVAELRMNSAVRCVAAAVNSRMGVRVGTGTGSRDVDRPYTPTLTDNDNRFYGDQSMGSAVEGRVDGMVSGESNNNVVEEIRRASTGMCLDRSSSSQLYADPVKDCPSTVGTDAVMSGYAQDFIRPDEYLRNGSDALTQSSQRTPFRKSLNQVISIRKQFSRQHPVGRDSSAPSNRVHVDPGGLSGPRTNSRLESGPGSGNGEALFTRVGREGDKEGNTRHSKSAGDFRSVLSSPSLSTSTSIFVSNGRDKAAHDGRYHGQILFASTATAQARDVVNILERVSMLC